MQTVFVLQHEHEIGGGCENELLIGVYSSHTAAEAAIERVRSQPGFREWPDGFNIYSYVIDEDNWKEGFCSVAHILVELKGSEAPTWKCVGAESLPGDRYRIFLSEGDTDTARWAFTPGQIVRCERRTHDGEPNCLVAVELVE